MDIFFQIMLVLIPAGGVFAISYFFMKQFFDDREQQMNHDLRAKTIKDMVPTKMQAYERLILLMERIAPDQLVMRTQKSGMTARQHHQIMLQTIREEYEHNLSQQLYVSDSAWRLVKQAKEEAIRIVNIAGSKMSDEGTALDMSKMVLSVIAQLDNLPTAVAISGLKKEFKAIYG